MRLLLFRILKTLPLLIYIEYSIHNIYNFFNIYNIPNRNIVYIKKIIIIPYRNIVEYYILHKTKTILNHVFDDDISNRKLM